MSFFQRLLPWGVVGVAVVYLGFAMNAPGPRPKTPDYSAAGKMPVLHGGRVKPMDTLAPSPFLSSAIVRPGAMRTAKSTRPLNGY